MVAVAAGALCAAALTTGVGNTIATVLIGGGLLAIVFFLLRDMGLIDTGDDRTPPAPTPVPVPAPPPPGNGGDPQHGPGAGNGAAPAGESPEGPRERRTVDVRRPDRMRGQRRRLR